MNSRAVPHLLPCMKAVTIRAKKPKVPLVRFPVSESVVPNGCSTLVAQLPRWVDVVNIQNPKVILATSDALSAKPLDNLKLSRPVTRVLVYGKAILIPVVGAALRGAKPMLADFTAPFAGRLPLPSGLKITSLVAVFPGSVLKPVGVGFADNTAVSASDLNLWGSFLSHATSVVGAVNYINIFAEYVHLYFEIALRRISEALKAPDLFIEAPKPVAKQESLL